MLILHILSGAIICKRLFTQFSFCQRVKSRISGWISPISVISFRLCVVFNLSDNEPRLGWKEVAGQWWWFKMIFHFVNHAKLPVFIAILCKSAIVQDTRSNEFVLKWFNSAEKREKPLNFIDCRGPAEEWARDGVTSVKWRRPLAWVLRPAIVWLFIGYLCWLPVKRCRCLFWSTAVLKTVLTE